VEERHKNERMEMKQEQKNRGRRGKANWINEQQEDTERKTD
jgi:hypothetical protein